MEKSAALAFLTRENHPLLWKEVRVMESFLAKSDRQLGICIRMLNDEGFSDLSIHSETNAKNRMEVLVYIETDADTYERLLKRYLTLIS